MSKTSALANSVPTSSAVQAASASLAVALPDPAPEGHLGRPPATAATRIARRSAPPAGPSRRVPRALGHLRPAAARPSIAGIAALTRSPAEIAARDEVVETVTKSCGSSASRPSATTPDAERAALTSLRARLERLHRFERRAASATSRTPGATSSPRPPARPASASAGAAARLEPPLRLAQLVLERGDPVRQRVDATGRRPPRPPARGRRTASRTSASAAGAGDRLDAAHPGADAPLAGDDEAADLAGGAAVRAAAQLEAVVLDADGADRLAVLLVEERVGAALDRLGHAS